MHVLNVTNLKPPFYREQVSGLRRLGVTVEEVAVPSRHDLNSPLRIVDYLRFFPMVRRAVDERFDLIHANYGLTAPMALAQRRLPVVLSLWGTDLYGPLGPLTRSLAPFCDEVIVMSDGMRHDLSTSATVIPHGLDLDQFVPIDQELARESVGWSSDTYHILFPYDPNRPEKDHPRAAQVIEGVKAEVDKPVKLSVVTGVPHEEFVDYLNAADALLMTSRYEGSPNVVKEALACNLPVVSTDVGDVRERLDDVEQCYVATNNEDLVSSLGMVLRSGKRSDGRKAVQDLSLERTSKRLVSVYEKALRD